jgi:transcriptional regulator with XRE-family HTH domain
MDIAALAQDITMKRGTVGVRAAARDAGISPATLSRIENGHVPDLETFEKICQWLGKDPRRFLAAPPTSVVAAVQFRKKGTVKKETADALGSLIMAVQAMLEAETGGAESV